MKPFFSVIVPMHNSAEFMRKGLDSVRRQTFDDYELIIICDKCEDNTAEIAREYSDIVLEVDYGKAGLARNDGLDIAAGEWILFMDDDDWFLHEYVFEILHNRLDGRTCDILAFGFLCDWKTGKGLEVVPYLHTNGRSIWVAPWTKAWRREFIGNHRFPAWKHSDDLGFAEIMFPRIRRREILDAPMYFYNYMRPGSTQDRLRTGELTYDDMRE